MAKPLRVALVGLRGLNHWMYRPAMEEVPDARIVAGVDLADEAREKVAEFYDVPLVASLAEAVEQAAPEAVIISTPNHIHLTNVREAAAAGLHMMVTKPLCPTIEDCREAIRIARDAGLVLQTGHEYRYRPSIVAALAEARAGKLGRVSLVTGHMGSPGGIGKLAAVGSWRADPANAPGGCGAMLGVHHIDVANAVLGAPRRVTGSLRRVHPNSALEDTVAVTIEYDNGTAVCTSSYATSCCDELHVYGDEANAVASDSAAWREVKRERTKLPLGGLSSGAALIKQLVAAVREGRPVETDGAVGLMAVAVLQAAIRSCRQGRPVVMAELLKE